MAKRGGTKQTAIRCVTKRIYLQHHLTVEAQEETCTHGTHIKAEGYRRHKSGKVLKLKIAS